MSLKITKSVKKNNKLIYSFDKAQMVILLGITDL